jgi:hypothetical protein
MGNRLPVKPPKQIDAIGEDDDWMETNVAYTERLAHAIGMRNYVAVDEGDIQTIGMTQSHHGLMEIRQPT